MTLILICFNKTCFNKIKKYLNMLTTVLSSTTTRTRKWNSYKQWIFIILLDINIEKSIHAKEVDLTIKEMGISLHVECYCNRQPLRKSIKLDLIMHK
jgi:hypothetical protein